MTATTAPAAERGWARWAVLGLALATAAIHASRAMVDAEISTLFWLNAIGYVVLGAAYALPIPALDAWRGKVRWVLIAYTATTIVLFFLWGFMSGDWPVIGFVDKAIEVALIAILWLDRRA